MRMRKQLHAGSGPTHFDTFIVQTVHGHPRSNSQSSINLSTIFPLLIYLDALSQAISAAPLVSINRRAQRVPRANPKKQIFHGNLTQNKIYTQPPRKQSRRGSRRHVIFNYIAYEDLRGRPSRRVNQAHACPESGPTSRRDAGSTTRFACAIFGGGGQTFALAGEKGGVDLHS